MVGDCFGRTQAASSNLPSVDCGSNVSSIFRLLPICPTCPHTWPLWSLGSTCVCLGPSAQSSERPEQWGPCAPLPPQASHPGESPQALSVWPIFLWLPQRPPWDSSEPRNRQQKTRGETGFLHAVWVLESLALLCEPGLEGRFWHLSLSTTGLVAVLSKAGRTERKGVNAPPWVAPESAFPPGCLSDTLFSPLVLLTPQSR